MGAATARMFAREGAKSSSPMSWSMKAGSWPMPSPRRGLNRSM
jgi:hypothetical protein